MPNTHDTLTSLFSDIAQAIRDKKGETSETTYIADDFPSAIAAIPGGTLTSIVKCSPEKGTASSATTGTVTATYTFDKVANAICYIVVSQASCIQGAVNLPTDYTQYVALFDGTSIVSQTDNHITFVGESNNQYTFTSSLATTGTSPRTRVSLYAYAIL